MTPESHSGSVMASGVRYTNISVGICLWKLKRIVENKIFCAHNLSCVPLVSPICHFWMIDPCSKIWVGVLRPDSVSPDPSTAQSVIWLILLIERETEIFEKIFQKYSIFASQAVSRVNISEFCKNIYKHLTRQNWLTNVYQHSTTLQPQQTKEEVDKKPKKSLC